MKQQNVRSLLQNQCASVTIMVGFAMFLMIMCVGTAIDMARGQTLQTRMQSALDAAGMAAATTASNTDVQTQAQKYFNANFSRGYLDSNSETIQVTATDTSGVITLTATTPQSTTFLSAVGIPQINVAVAAKVSIGQSPPGMFITNTQNPSSANNNVIVLDSTDTYQTKFGGTGFQDGQLSYPTAIAADQKGNMWVTDSKNNRVQIFSLVGGVWKWQKTIPSNCSNASIPACAPTPKGTKPQGTFTEPFLIGADSNGDMWISSGELFGSLIAGEFYVQKFHSDGTYANVTLSVDGAHMAVNPVDNTLWVISEYATPNPTAGLMSEYDLSAGGALLHTYQFTTVPGRPGVPLTTGEVASMIPSFITFDKNGAAWMTNMNGTYPGVYEFKDNGSGIKLTQYFDFANAGYAKGCVNNGLGGVGHMGGLAIDASGNFWITSITCNIIMKFDSSLTYKSYMGVAATNKADVLPLSYPVSILMTATASSSGGKVHITQ